MRGVVNGGLALENDALHFAVGFYGERGGGDVDTDAFGAAAQVLHGKRVVHFAGVLVVNGKGDDVFGKGQIVFRLPWRGNVVKADSLRKVFVFKALH